MVSANDGFHIRSVRPGSIITIGSIRFLLDHPVSRGAAQVGCNGSQTLKGKLQRNVCEFGSKFRKSREGCSYIHYYVLHRALHPFKCSIEKIMVTADDKLI